MSIQITNLNKLLRLCALPENQLISDLRSDLRAERDKKLGKKGGGGHFHHPWWDVAKDHVVGMADLTQTLPLLISINPPRDRLYRMLTNAFLRWLDDLRRTTNLVERRTVSF